LKKCSECGGSLKKIDGEVICINCGLVLDEEVVFGEVFGRFEQQGGPAPVTRIAPGKGLGGTLRDRGLYVVIGKANGYKDLPIRATQIRNITKFKDPPTLQHLLEKGIALLTEYGYRTEAGGETKPEHIFADTYGVMLRMVGGKIAYGNLRIRNYKRVAEAVFFEMLKKYDPEKAEKLKPHLSFKESHLSLIAGLLDGIAEVKENG